MVPLSNTIWLAGDIKDEPALGERSFEFSIRFWLGILS
jgi:hypothetical protein